jgi:hypothetical protein
MPLNTDQERAKANEVLTNLHSYASEDVQERLALTLCQKDLEDVINNYITYSGFIQELRTDTTPERERLLYARTESERLDEAGYAKRKAIYDEVLEQLTA